MTTKAPPTIPPEPADDRRPAGAWWCSQFPTERTTAGLAQPFRGIVQDWISALERGYGVPHTARCTVKIAATRRPYLRAWLMRRCWEIVKEGKNPATMPVHAEIPIRWTKEGAAEMFAIYGLVARPSLTSRHIDGRAIDCTITGWPTSRADLDAYSRARRVYPLAGDPVHWSEDGH